MSDKDLEFDENGDLVEPEGTKRESVAYLSKEKANRLCDFLKYSEIADVNVEYDHLNDTYNVSVLSKEFEKAQNLYEVFDANETSDSESENLSFEKKDVNLYENSTEKYKDNLSSAITFFICGGAGLIVLLLNDFGVLKLIEKGSSSFILMNVVLGLLFAAFLVIGFMSLKYSKKIKNTATKEEEALNKVSDWLKENVTLEAIESSYDNSIPEEMKYFSRIEFVKKAIEGQYPELDEATVEFVSDQYLEELF